MITKFKMCMDGLTKLKNKILYYMKLKEMDYWWYYMGGACFGLFPPSFYYTHTEEEMECMIKEALTELRNMVDELASVQSHEMKNKRRNEAWN